MLTITPISALRDNYIWVIHNQQFAALVDPGEAAPVFEFLQQQKLTPIAILNTHRHHDHVNGIAELTARFNLAVYGKSHANKSFITHELDEGDRLHLPQLGTYFDILHTPGHLDDHIVFHSEVGLFCGDMIFGAGCGRNFEGDISALYHSLQRLKNLPEHTLIYSAHEYTRANIKFALNCEPRNTAIQQRAEQLEQSTGISLPSNIALERATNPFMRCESSELIDTLEKQQGLLATNAIEVFAALRLWRNNFSIGV